MDVQWTGWKRSLPDDQPERASPASGLAEIRGKLVPRLAGESHLATDNGPVLLNPIGNGSETNWAALGWVHVDNECNFHYDVVITSSGSGGSSSRPEKYPAVSPSSNRTAGRRRDHADGRQRTERWNRFKYGQVHLMPNIRLHSVRLDVTKAVTESPWRGCHFSKYVVCFCDVSFV